MLLIVQFVKNLVSDRKKKYLYVKLTARYYWNIVESGVKHHKPPTTNNLWCKNGNKSTEAASYYQLWKEIINSADQQIH